MYRFSNSGWPPSSKLDVLHIKGEAVDNGCGGAHTDITTYQGGFCFIEDHIKFKFIELNSSLGIIINDLSSNYPTPDIGAYQFLVVSFCGDLLLV
jgi:hypothetical protein